MFRRATPIAFMLCIHAVLPLCGQSVGPLAMPAFLGTAAPAEPPPRLAPQRLARPLASLSAAAVGARDGLAAIEAWNASGRLPLQNGFRRSLPLPLAVRLTAERAGDSAASDSVSRRADGGLVWGTRVEVESAYRLRLHLSDVALPAGAKLWVYNESEARGPFGVELIGPGGDLWTPSVGGGTLWIEAELPAGALGASAAYGFTVNDVLEIVGAAPRRLINVRQASTVSCLVDEPCVAPGTLGSIDSYRKAIASLEFVKDGSSYLCTGGLLNNTKADGTPYLLTANHCLSTQAVASTLEAVWDYYDGTCLGNTPDRATLPSSQGATLLASSLQSDFTLVRLNSIPGPRSLLGWNADPRAVTDGTSLFRLSHPVANGILLPQFFSASTARYGSALPCPVDPAGRPMNDLTKFIHSLPTVGTPLPGSSGAPLVLGSGQVVGQLLGACGSFAGVSDPCLAGTSINQIDGAFAATFPAVAAWLDPAASSPFCIPSGTTLCLDDTPGDRRFKVEVSFQAVGASPAPGNAVPLASLGIANGGVFWFFNPGNPEMLVKVLNGCGLGGHYWVFYAAATNVGLTTTVTDTVTGAHKTYANAAGTAAAPVQDTAALPCS